MQRFKKLGVFLHDSPADEAALAYAGVVATLAQSESVHCVHVRDDDEGDEPDLQAFQQEVRQQLPDPVAAAANIEIRSGTGVQEILKTARDDALDLIIVGRRLPSEQLGIGSAFARLARKAPCSVLAVPTQSRPHLERFFVSVDFSDHAKLALDQASGMARTGHGDRPQLVVHSNFSVGYGYTKLGLTLPQAIQQRRDSCREKLQKLVDDIDTSGMEVELVCTCSEQPESAILEAAVARKMDLIVVGSRGTSSVFMLGSTAERVLLHSVLPVLIVKQKGETQPILDALFGS